MKKIISLILTFVILLSVASITVFADSVSGYDVNTHKITATATGKLNVYFSHDYKTDCSWTVRAYKQNYDGSRSQCFTKIVYGESGTNALPAIGCKNGEVFIFEVSFSSLSYELNYNMSYSCTSAVYESELNNDFNTADTLYLGKKTTANCWNYDLNNEEDWFKVYSPIKGNLSLKFSHAYAMQSKGWKVSIFKQDSFGSLYTLVNEETVTLDKPNKVFTIKAEKGTNYYIKVFWPYSSNFNIDEYIGTEYSITPTIKCAKPGNPTAKVTTGKVNCKWKSAKSVSGYQIQISQKSNFKKKIVNKLHKKCKYNKKLSRNKTYYIRVRSFKKVNKVTYYSKWSKKVAFRVK